MLKTLTHAPCVRSRVPVQLVWSEPGHQRFSAIIRSIQFADQSGGPGGRAGSSLGLHGVIGNRELATGEPSAPTAGLRQVNREQLKKAIGHGPQAPGRRKSYREDSRGNEIRDAVSKYV